MVRKFIVNLINIRGGCTECHSKLLSRPKLSATLVNYFLSESYQVFLRITTLINIGEIYTFC